MRFALKGGGKSGGLRVLYVYAKHDERFFLLLGYPKNVRATLTQGEEERLETMGTATLEGSQWAG